MRTLVIMCLGFSLVACGEQKTPAPKIPEVFVVSASEQPYHLSRTLNARVQSANDVDITAEVSGKLVSIHFKEGDQVKKDTLLFKLDSKTEAANLVSAKSELNVAKTELEIAVKNYQRGKQLVDEGVLSELDFDKLSARKLSAESRLETAKAVVDAAQIEMGFTRIKAPMDGRIGRSNPAVGDLVGPESGALTTLIGEGGMQVVLQLPERLVLRMQAPGSNIAPENIVVSVQLEDGTESHNTGRLDYFSNRVDPATGTVEVRANLPETDMQLRPGMFVRAILSLKDPLQSLLIPQAAVLVDQLGSYVLVADLEDKVSRKNVDTADRVGEQVVIIDGLTAGDRIIIRGIQKARPGDKVKVLDFVPATSSDGS